jgi:hypothetical protein
MNNLVAVALIGAIAAVGGGLIEHGTSWVKFFIGEPNVDPSIVSQCKIARIYDGEVRSSTQGDEWKFSADFLEKKYSSHGPTEYDKMIAAKFDYACDEDIVFFYRSGLHSFGGGARTVSCCHFGRISGTNVTGTYACEQQADTNFTWNGKVQFKWSELNYGDSAEKSEASSPQRQTLMRYEVVIENAEGDYSACAPDLPGCVAAGATA